MDFKQYQEKAHGTSLNTVISNNEYASDLLKATESLGEILGLVKKLYRDKNGEEDNEFFLKFLDNITNLDIHKTNLLNTIVTKMDPSSDGDSNACPNYMYPVLGLGGEVGEVLGKFSKYSELKPEHMDDTIKKQIRGELGGVLWYISEICTQVGIDLNEVAEENVKILQSRKERGVIHGSGDER